MKSIFGGSIVNIQEKTALVTGVSGGIGKAVTPAWKTYGSIHLLVNCLGVAYQAPFLYLFPIAF